MKKKPTQSYQLFAYLLCVILIGVMLSSCEAEKDFAKDNKFIVKRCSLKDLNLKSNNELRKAVNYLKRLQQNVNSRIVYDENSGLYFNDEKGIYLLQDGKESYTFPTIQTDVSEKIQNITFNKNDIGEYDIYIVKYDYTKEDLDNYSKEELAEREIKYQALLKNGVEYPIEAQWWVCVETTTTTTYYEDHPGEGTGGSDIIVVCVSVSISTSCIYGNDGGLGDGGTGGGGTGGGTGGGGGSDGTTPTPPTNPTNSGNENPGSPILTAAIIDFDSGDAIQFPPDNDDSTITQSLNELTNRPEVKERIIEIKNQVSTVASEQGSEFFTDPNNPANPFEREDLASAYSGIRFGPVYSQSIVRLHSHHEPALEPVFSGQDVAGMAKFYKTKRDLGDTDAINATSILASNLGIHALRVTNPEKANLFAQRLGVTAYVKQFIINYGLNVQNKAKRDCNCSENNTEYQQLLLQYLVQFLADQDTGIAIFTGTVNSDGNITWTR